MRSVCASLLAEHSCDKKKESERETERERERERVRVIEEVMERW